MGVSFESNDERNLLRLECNVQLTALGNAMGCSSVSLPTGFTPRRWQATHHLGASSQQHHKHGTTRAVIFDILYNITGPFPSHKLIYMVPNAMISSGTSTTLHLTYSAMNLPRMSYVAFAVTPRSSQSCSRKCTAQIPGNSMRSMTWPS